MRMGGLFNVPLADPSNDVTILNDHFVLHCAPLLTHALSLKNAYILVELMHSFGNLFQSFTIPAPPPPPAWANVYFLMSNLEWTFTKARRCPLVSSAVVLKSEKHHL